MCPGMDGVFHQLRFLLLPQDLAECLPSIHESTVHFPAWDKSGLVMHAYELWR